ncbi:retrovirus-related pol polyprotein from transposon TNT 1-94 [Tanacetum coccineum]|uniref:Retrovirus-related pol polyprotein from transposon TNT 1-94 n=1 Tax=Tanacetum coccineum TaxID=301880 RepID=A0ABQ5AAF4_9ASTR
MTWKSLSKTLIVFKTEFKEKEYKYIDKEIVFEKQNKELDNIISLGYQNPFHLKKAQRIQPTLYDGSVIAKEHDVIYVIDDEETLILEEESRSKMLDKQNDPISIEKKIKISPIDYSNLNKIKEDFGKHFVTQKELSAEQAFWLKHSSLSETPVTSHTPVRIEAPSELPKVAVDQCSVHKNVFEIQIKQLRIDNDQLLNQIMSQEILNIVANYVDIFDVKKSCVNDFNKCLELETGLFKKKDFIEKETYDKLVKSYSNLEKHYISLELATQLNQEIFQRENSDENLNAPTFNQLFEINELKAQSQENDIVIRKLKERIKSLSGKDSVVNVKKDIDEIETINIELEHSVARLLSENKNLRKEREHLKSIFKDQFDSIRKTRIQSKEHCDSLIAQINAKSVENSDLNAQLQEKAFAITALKNKLRKLKGENVVNTVVSKPNATIAPRMFKLDIKPISPRLKKIGMLMSEPLLESACMFTKHVQELLVYVSQTCPSSLKPSRKLVVVTPINKDKRVRFAEPVTSSNNIPKQNDSLKTKDSNKPLLTTTGVKPTTSASGSKPSGNTKNNRITRPPRSNQKNKVEDHSMKVKSSLNKTNSISESISNALVKHSVKNAKFEYICAICNKCLFDANHDMCLINFVKDVNVRSKSKSKRNIMRKAWKPIGSNATDFPSSSSSVVIDTLSKLSSGSRDTNLYTISLDDMLKTSPIYLLSKASKTKIWLWHHFLSHLNLGKSKKSSHQPKVEDTNEEKLYLMHMDLCGPMRDEAPDAIIKCIKNIQVRLNAAIRNVRTYNGTEFVNQTLRDFYENVGISHQTSVARTPQQNSVVKRRNRTFVEVARTMLIFSKAPLILWAEAIDTAFRVAAAPSAVDIADSVRS